MARDKLCLGVDQRCDKPAYQRAWRKARKDHVSSWGKEYRRKTQEKQILIRVKKRAKTLGLPFNLTEEDIIIPKYCPILGLKLEMAGSNRNCSPSLDRLIPEKGYVKGNVSVISNRANSLKSNMTLQEIIKLAEWAKNNAD